MLRQTRLKTSAKAANLSNDEENDDDDNDDDDEDNDDDDDNDDVDDDADNQDDKGQDNDNEKTDSDKDGVEFGEELWMRRYSNEEDEANELYRDVNVNLEGRDIEMTDAPRIIRLNYSSNRRHSYTSIDSIFNLNTESTSLVDFSATTIAETLLSSATTLHPPPILFIINCNKHSSLRSLNSMYSSSSLQDLPNFGSLFGFDHRLKTLETDFLKFKQTNQFAATVSSIPGIVDTYLANKINEAIKIAVQLQSERLRNEAQADNEDFINKLDDNIKKIINEQVLTRSSNESKTSHDVAANLSKFEMKKILIDKMESNKSIHISDEQKNLYKALVDAYKSDKLILDTYGDTVSFKRHLEEPAHQEFDTGLAKDQPFDETTQHHDWFKKQKTSNSRSYSESWNNCWSSTFELMKDHARVWWNLNIFLKKSTRNGDKLYTFKEGDYKRLRLQDIEDILLLLVQVKLTNLTIEERLALNISLRMFTRRFVIQRRMEDL
ncbi:hypothetical protein Tco_0006691 [Tanacetum coccineum]